MQVSNALRSNYSWLNDFELLMPFNILWLRYGSVIRVVERVCVVSVLSELMRYRPLFRLLINRIVSRVEWRVIVSEVFVHGRFCLRDI